MPSPMRDPDSPTYSKRDLLATVGPFVLLGLVLLAIAYWVLEPAPPRHVVLATGTAQGAYAEFGEHYVDILARHGIEVELRATQGSALRRSTTRSCAAS